MTSLAQLKASSIKNIAGVNVQDPQFVAYVNEAVRTLIRMGEWWGTVKAMVGTSYNGCMVWPAQIDSVLATNVNCRPATVANYWYEFLPIETCFNGRMSDGIRDFVSTFPNYPECPKPVVRFSGTLPVFYPPSVLNPFAAQVTCDNTADYGKTITIYGKDTNGMEVVAVRNDGTTQRGYQLIVGPSNPFTTVTFSEISAVVKDLTVANIRLWVYDPTAAFGTPIAIYQPNETNPEYLFSELARVPYRTHGTVCVKQHLEALVKLSFVPVVQDSDLILLDNIDAIKSMIQSIRFRESGDDDNANKMELNAVRRLNAELRSRFPNQQVVARSNPVGLAIYSPI